MVIGDRLRLLREQKNLSQGDIEKVTGLIRAYISRVENGHTVPSLSTLEKFARALEVPMYQLFYDGEEPPKLKNLFKGKTADEVAFGSTGDQARDESTAQFRDRLLQQAQTSAEKALELNGRKNWTPAQLNLARIFFAQKRIDDATTVLQKILGAIPVPAASPAQPPPPVDVSSIASTIIGMAPAGDAIAIADIIRAAWGQLTPAGLQALLPAVAGRVTPALLSKIFERLPHRAPER
jgi:transcriptional regulator with XRE-family HTH domain